MGRRLAVAMAVAAACSGAACTSGASAATARCLSASASTTRSPTALLCGPMVFTAPGSWATRLVGHSFGATPECCERAPFLVWLGSGPAAGSLAELRRRLGLTTARLGHFGAGPALVAGGQLARDYWFLHDHVSYVLHTRADRAFLEAERPTVERAPDRISFDDDAAATATVIDYAGWKARVGAARSLEIAVDRLQLSVVDPRWEVHVSFRNTGVTSVGIRRIDALFATSAAVTAATTENVSPSSSYASAVTGDDAEHLPLQLRPGESWAGVVSGSPLPLAGRYAALRIAYTVGKRAGVFTFPARARPAAPAGSEDPFPLVYVGSDQSTGVPITLALSAYDLAKVARTRQISIAVPAGYGVKAAAPGSVLGRAELRRATRVGGRATFFAGRIVASGRWSWVVRVRSKKGETLELPLSLDGSTLTLLVPRRVGVLTSFAFAIHRVFRTPEDARRYLFDVEVVPAALDGSALVAGAYELRAYENLAAGVSVRAVYRRAGRSLTITGAIHGDLRARRGTTVFLYAAPSRRAGGYTHLATVHTRRGGRFTFTTRIYPPPGAVFAFAANGVRRGCDGVPRSPGGCSSQTSDGIDSRAVDVQRR